MKRKAKKYWIIAGISTLALSIIGGLVAFGLFQTQPSLKLDAPQNFEYTINFTNESKTEYIFSWDLVPQASGYTLTIEGANVKKTELELDKELQEYNISDYLTENEKYNIELKAIGDKKVLSSNALTKSFVFETVPTGLKYEKIEGGYEVSRGNAGYVSKMILPDTYNGLPILKIADKAFGSNTKQDVIMKAVRLPNYLKVIGNTAFCNCSELDNIILPETVIEIGPLSFGYCTFLKQIDLPKDLKVLPASCFVSCDFLQTVKFSERLERIEQSAFSGCQTLKEIVLPNNLQFIGSTAFRGCLSLTQVAIPDSVKRIEGGAFLDCQNLEKITLPSGIEYIESDILDNTKWLESQTGEFVCLGDWLYRYREEANAKNIEISAFPKGVKKIAARAFRNCRNIVSVVFPNGLEDLFKNTFAGCWSLERVSFPSSLKRIGEAVFDDCKKLDGIILPSELESIDKSAFRGCEKLTEIEIPNGLTSLEDNTFRLCKNLRKITLPESLTAIGEGAFYGCYKLVEVVNFSSSITISKGAETNGEIGYYALSVYNYGDCLENKFLNDNGYIIYTDGAEKILVSYEGEDTDLVLPSYVTKINDYAFFENKALTSVVITDSVKVVGEYAFSDCRRLTSVTIGNGVTSINSNAFSHCKQLKIVQTGNNLVYIGEEAFYNCRDLTRLELPKTLLSIGKSAFYVCYKLVEVVNSSPHITVEKGSNDNGYLGRYAIIVFNSEDSYEDKFSVDKDGYVFYTEGEEKILTGYEGNETDLVLPSYVTKINDYAFFENTALTGVEISSNVLVIGGHAFDSCANLQNVILQSGVLIIGEAAFQHCTKLMEIIIPDSVKTIKSEAFWGCSKISNIVLPNSITVIEKNAFTSCGFEKVILPESISIIADGTFSLCRNLKSLVIPKSIKSVGVGVLMYVDEFERIFYMGTREDWSRISVGSNNSSLTQVTIYYYLETEPPLNSDGTEYDGNYWYYGADGVPKVWEYQGSE